MEEGTKRESSEKKREGFRMRMPYVYDYFIENNLEWPASGCRWGKVLERNKDYIKQEVYFSCRTDATYNQVTATWKKLGSFIILATIGRNSLSFVWGLMA